MDLTKRRLGRWMALLGLAVAAVTAVGTPLRATYGARTTADEPQYLLTAMSLGEDGDLDIGDERRGARYREFHEATLPDQELVQPGGQRLSPHEPLLPAVLAVPMRLGGWVAAKLTMAAMAGALAALTLWVAVRRLRVPLPWAALVVGAFAVAPPLSVYGTQVYPELPAALALLAGVAAVPGLPRRGPTVAFAAAVVALPWLGVKYLPVAAVLALWGLRRRPGLAGVFALAALAWVVFHQQVYGGWTSYAAGDHFVGGEATVMGVDPDYAGRTVRLSNLFLDRHFGLAVWQPLYLLAVPAVVAWARQRRPEALVVAAGWATATWVALTMHGWWWPGRQVVVVAPLLVLAVAHWTARWQPRALVAAGAAWGAAAFAFLAVQVGLGHHTLVVDFDQTANPLVRALRVALPDGRDLDLTNTMLFVAWTAALAALAAWGWTTQQQEETDEEGDVGTGGRAGPGRVRSSLRRRRRGRAHDRRGLGIGQRLGQRVGQQVGVGQR